MNHQSTIRPELLPEALRRSLFLSEQPLEATCVPRPVAPSQITGASCFWHHTPAALRSPLFFWPRPHSLQDDLQSPDQGLLNLGHCSEGAES